jgi:murein DD-endopeptidase MepM/ murein hydrolase activator NlpD
LEIRSKNLRLWLIVTVGIFVIIPAGLISYLRLEGEKPAINLRLPFEGFGRSQEFSLTVSDRKSGLRRLWIGISKANKDFVLLEKNFPSGGLLGLERIKDESFNILVDPRKLGITDGKATLLIEAKDYSWRRWWNGNKTLLEKEVTIDTRAPQIEVLSGTHNINQGGAGFVIYSLSEPCLDTGVLVGENFFPAYSGQEVFDSKPADIFVAFIALSYKQGDNTALSVKATDYAGNISSAGFRYYIKKKNFKQDVIQVSDTFLTQKIPQIDVGEIPMDTDGSQNPAVQTFPELKEFLAINNTLRAANYRQMVEISKQSDNKMYWKGAFIRLPKSARQAGFADHREYEYQGQIIDRQVHEGIDLASIANSPVPAANTGKVVFTGRIGIYGKTVMIDHGLGLFTTYSHLSNILVQEGQMVSKEDVVGDTGRTGFAFGDHLHFGVLIHNTFVDPIEWWDAHWIKDNVLEKMKAVK